MTSDNQSNFNAPPPEENGSESDGLNTGIPKVSAAPGKIFFVIGGIAAFVIFIVWLMSGGGPKNNPDEVSTESKTVAKQEDVPPPPPPPPADIIPPPRQIEQPPDLPPPPENITEPPVISEDASTMSEARRQRLQSQMIVLSGTANHEDENEAADQAGDPNSGFATRARMTKAATAKAGRMGNLDLIIGQGKLIHAVLETAINTQLPGPIRAIVSRDTYAESGKNILIPKGSRLIGTYNTNLLQGQRRVFIVWQRVMRPDGIDIFVNSPGVDMLGRAGINGYVDNRLQQIFSGAIMTSLVTLGVAYASEQFLGADQTTSTTNTDGSNTTTSSPVSKAADAATDNINDVGKRVLDRIIDTRPVVTVDQGTKINVMLNRDLIFPADAAVGSARIVP